jgi:hypothetical protein
MRRGLGPGEHFEGLGVGFTLLKEGGELSVDEVCEATGFHLVGAAVGSVCFALSVAHLLDELKKFFYFVVHGFLSTEGRERVKEAPSPRRSYVHRL